MKIKRPSFQFYPGDWLQDAALRTASVGARGLWMDMICFMHQGSSYGYLKVNGKVILPSNLARMSGATFEEVEGWLYELEGAGVFGRDDENCIFSKRMVRDEEIRAARAAGGKLGGNPNLKAKNKVNLPSNLPPTPSSSSSSSSSKDTKAMSEPSAPDAPVDDESVEKRAKRRPSEDDYKTARWLYGCQKGINPDAKSPNFDTWADDVRLMREVDKREHRAICELFKFAKNDSFWAPNIQCPSKLREKWDQLTELRARPTKTEKPQDPRFFGLDKIEHTGEAMAASMKQHGIVVNDDDDLSFNLPEKQA